MKVILLRSTQDPMGIIREAAELLFPTIKELSEDKILKRIFTEGKDRP